MKHKVSELEGRLLDAAVAKAEGDALPDFWRDPDDGTCWSRPGRETWRPSERWDQGGPIIERALIDISAPEEWSDDQRWYAGMYQGKDAQHSCMKHEARGVTPLIAAMRCYVASNFGDEVEI